MISVRIFKTEHYILTLLSENANVRDSGKTSNCVVFTASNLEGKTGLIQDVGNRRAKQQGTKGTSCAAIGKKTKKTLKTSSLQMQG